ncbi:hypothetical protein N9H60_02860 [Flavimaricola sp.]|nr:hypothetical protein [Flavimaricola sp.]MDA9020100.1 hypothetical protein [Flavimaricola sp.]
MANSKKSKSSTQVDPKIADDIDDAVIVSDDAVNPESQGSEQADSVDPEPQEAVNEDVNIELDATSPEHAHAQDEADTALSDPQEDGDNAENMDNNPAADESPADEYPTDEPPSEDLSVEEPPPEVVSSAEPAAQVTVQKVGFVPLVLGGVIAGGLGFGAAYFTFGQQGLNLTTELSVRLSALEAQVSGLPTEVPDITPVEAAVAAVRDDLSAQIAEISSSLDAQIAAFDDRLVGIERAPSADGTLPESAVASWEQELDVLRAEIAAQQSRMQEIAASAQSELDAARAAAQAVEQNAAEAAQQTVARAALARVQVALDSGTPFDTALADLAASGTVIPDTLAKVAPDGVPTIATLREEFPAAARAALSAARSEGLADTNANALTAFLRNQLGVRSVVPKDGDDPDAILSRAEAALADSRLTDALAEVASLPEVARGEMSSWVSLAEARAAAMSTVESLAQTLNN